MSSLVIAGDTSGTITLQAPAVAGSSVLTLPANTTANVALVPTSYVTVQTFTSGSGTYTTPTGVKYLHIKMCAGGGGGYPSGTSGASPAPTNGGNTTFGGTILTCTGGGVGAGFGGYPGIGGGASVNTSVSGVSGVAITGGDGAGADGYGPYGYMIGGCGGQNPFGGSGAGGLNNGSGWAAYNGKPNTGAGGGGQGGGYNNGGFTYYAGGGGGAGGYVEAIILNPNTTYGYVVGAGGTTGTPGGTGAYAANGAAGIIIVQEYYS